MAKQLEYPVIDGVFYLDKITSAWLFGKGLRIMNEIAVPLVVMMLGVLLIGPYVLQWWRCKLITTESCSGYACKSPCRNLSQN